MAPSAPSASSRPPVTDLPDSAATGLAAVSEHGSKGVVSSLALLLPAATTKRVFGWLVIAEATVGDDGPPRLALTIFTPWSPAYVNPWAITDGVPLPLASSTRTGRT